MWIASPASHFSSASNGSENGLSFVPSPVEPARTNQSRARVGPAEATSMNTATTRRNRVMNTGTSLDSGVGPTSETARRGCRFQLERPWSRSDTVTLQPQLFGTLGVLGREQEEPTFPSACTFPVVW